MRKFGTKKSISLLMAMTMITGNIGTGMPVMASETETDTAITSAKFSFGTEKLDGYTNVDAQTVYSDEAGYGFSTSEYPAQAEGWVGGVYYPRTVVFTESNSSYITDSSNYVTVASKVWKETESTGYGVYTYENTSTFDVKLDSADYTVKVELTNPTDTDVTVNLEAEDITKATGVVVKAHETKISTFTACLVDGRLNLKFLADSSATDESSAALSNVYLSKVEVEKQTREQGSKPTVFIASDSTVSNTVFSIFLPSPYILFTNLPCAFFSFYLHHNTDISSTFFLLLLHLMQSLLFFLLPYLINLKYPE